MKILLLSFLCMGTLGAAVVENAPGYNAWPMIQAVDGKLICTYSRGSGHSIGEGRRDAFARVSADGGQTWGDEVAVSANPDEGEVMIGKGLDSSGAALFWVRCLGKTKHHDLYRTLDGVTFEKIASPTFEPFPMQVTDIVKVKRGLLCLWFQTNYKKDGKSSWGTLESSDDGRTWTQKTIEKDLDLPDLPTEPSFVNLGDGRLLGIARTEIAGEKGGRQFQLTSTDEGLTWQKAKTNIGDIRISTPSLVYDRATGLVHNYYYERGKGKVKRRIVRADAIFARPTEWPEPTVVATGREERPRDAGNVNVTVVGTTHYLAYYYGTQTDAAVYVESVRVLETHLPSLSWSYRFDDGSFAPIDLQAQIDAVAAQGGGRIDVPKGRWLTDPIELKSRVELHLSAGCELFFTDELEKYLPAVRTTYEGIECLNYRPLISAYGATQIAITGRGKIEPQMGRWETWRWNGPGTQQAKAMLNDWGNRDVPVAERDLTKLPGAKTRPPFVEFNGCTDIRLEGFKLRNSPFWCIHLLDCDRAAVHGLSVSAFMNNSDGIDIECSRNVTVEDCSFDQGDDVIVLKSGKDRDGRRRATPTENVTIRRCRAGSGHGFLVAGSECSGGIRNVTMEDCLVDGSLATLFKVKTSPTRGGFVENLTMRRVTARTILDAVIDVKANYALNASAGDAEEVLTEIRGLTLEDISVGTANIRCDIQGDARRPVRDVRLANVTVGRCARADKIVHADVGTLGAAVVENVPAYDAGSVIQARIDAASVAGGGRVVVPAGRHLVGQIDLKSNVELHLEKGAVLEGKVGLANYRVTELPYSEGTWSAIISAIGVTNVAVTGEGEIFGNGTAWPQPEDYGGNQEGRRPRGLFFADCKGVRLADFKLRDAACWGVVLKCCEDVDIRRLAIDNHANANNDGIDVEAKNVVIADCDIDAGDDAVCLKSNTPDFVVENVLVTNVTARSHCNALKLGTASHGTMRNILFVDCRTESPRRDFIDRRFGRNRRWYEEDPGRVKHYPGGVHGEAAGSSSIVVENVDGGTVEDITYRNISVHGSRAPIFVRAGTRTGRSCGTPPSDKYVFRNITIENVTGEAMSAVASSVTGVPGCRITNVTLRNVNIVTRGGGENEAERTRPVPEVAGKYPDAHMFGCMLPAYGLYGRHVDGLKLENVSFTLTPGMSDCREMMLFDDVIRMPVAYWRFDEGDANPVCVGTGARIVSGYGRGKSLRLDSPRARASAKAADAVPDISATERPFTAMIRVRPDVDVVSDTIYARRGVGGGRLFSCSTSPGLGIVLKYAAMNKKILVGLGASLSWGLSCIAAEVPVFGEPNYNVSRASIRNLIAIQEQVDACSNACVVVEPLPRGWTQDDPVRVAWAHSAGEVYKLCDTNRIFYLSLRGECLEADGSLKRALYAADGLTLSEEGQKLYAQRLKKLTDWVETREGSCPASNFGYKESSCASRIHFCRDARENYARWWWNRLKDKLAQADEIRANKDGKVDLVLFGDSLSHRWEYEDSGAPIFAKLTAQYSVLNTAIGGDRWEQDLWIARSGILDGLKPRFVSILVGANNHDFKWVKDTPEKTVEGIRQIMSVVREKCPGAQIILYPSLLRLGEGERYDEMRTHDRKVRELTKLLAVREGAILLEFDQEMVKAVGADEATRKRFTTDFTHLSTYMFEKWYEALKPVLATPTVPAWNAKSREETLDWFLRNEYGVRPPAAEKPEVSFAPLGEDVTMMDGAAVRKRVTITYKGPYGTGSFPVTCFIPTAVKGPVPAFLLICNRNPVENIDPERVNKTGFWPAEEIVRRGYAAITFWNGDIAPDFAFGNTRGVFACYEDVEGRAKTDNYRPHNAWGTLSAWAWGASRVMDWIETEPALDAQHVAVVGHSRGGKTALLTGVTDTRFAMACVNDSGCSGAKLNRMLLPRSETIAIITRSFPYWFCNNYRLWVNRDTEMPYDQHQFLALMAPRLVAVGSAEDDHWAGQPGEQESCRLARAAWDDPAKVDYHIRAGGHNLTPVDWAAYMDFADRQGWKK